MDEGDVRRGNDSVEMDRCGCGAKMGRMGMRGDFRFGMFQGTALQLQGRGDRHGTSR